MNKKPKKTKTEKELAGWKFLRGFMHGSKYVVAETPVTVMALVEHEEWFTQSATKAASISSGLAMFIITVIVTLWCIVNKEKTFKKISPFITAAIYLIVGGGICLFLQSILFELGMLFLFTGAGMLIAVAEDTVERNAVQGKIDELEKVLTAAGLNSKENRKKEKLDAKIKRAKQEAEAIRRAVE